MILDTLPLNAGDCLFRPKPLPAQGILTGSDYVFNSSFDFPAKSGALYLFESYTLALNISEVAFVESVAAGLAAGYDDYLPTLRVTSGAAQGGSPTNFPPVYAASFGLNPIRMYADNPGGQPNSPFIIKVTGRLISVPSMGAPAALVALFGLNVYEIQSEQFKAAYRKRKLWCPDP